MKTPSFAPLHALYRCFYSKTLYREVAQRWQGLGLAYLLLVIGICMIPVAIKLGIVMQSIFTDEEKTADGIPLGLMQIVEQVPDMVFTNGALSLEAPQPYIIQHPQTNEPLIVIDTTGRFTTLEEARAPVLITRYLLIMREENFEVQRFSLVHLAEAALGSKPAQPIEINQDVVKNWVEVALKQADIVPFVFYFLKIFSMFLNFGFQVLLVAIFGSLMMSMMKLELPFKTLFRLSAVACTPVIIADTLPTLLGQQIFNQPALVYLTLHGVYMYIALEGNKRKI